MKVLLDERRGWRTIAINGVVAQYAGDVAAVERVAREFSRGGLEAAQLAMTSAIGHFAAVLKVSDKILAFTDHCRSIPLFYDENGTISNDANLACSVTSRGSIDEISALEAAMSGYATGPYTLFNGLRQLQAGEFLYHEPPKSPKMGRYFVYKPEQLRDLKSDDLIEHVGHVIDRAMQRVIDAANGAPVWVPLSAGLDSRIILCKLAEFGCSNLRSFSYGPAGNDEARGAREVAARLKVPWTFVTSRRHEMQEYFQSSERRAYWEFADGNCTLPNPQDILPLQQMMHAGDVRPGDFVVNGQTGDFITGNHIPETLMADGAGVAELVDAIIIKHFSVWQSLKTEGNLSKIKSRILENLGLQENDDLDRQEAAAAFEQWEYQERQAKFIVAGERIYDFLGLSWRLPLWDQGIVFLFRDLPARVKFRQAPYRAYLQDYDYKGLFRNFHQPVWHWPGLMKAVLPVARVIRLTKGVKARDRFLKAMMYFGNYRHHYAPFRYRDFLEHVDDLRSPISLLVALWLSERGISVPGLPQLKIV